MCLRCPDGHFCERIGTTDTEATANVCDLGFTCRIKNAAGVHITTTDPVTLAVTYYGIDFRPYHISKYSCPPGYTCDSKVATPCPAGTYQPYWGGNGGTIACLPVPKGYYTNTAGSATYLTQPCARGHYCPAGVTTGVANACPAKTFRYYESGEQLSDCGACPSGYFCPAGTADPFVCPNGYYCPKGTEVPLVCPIGTFGPGEGIALETDCAPCYGGRYCSQYGLIKPEGLCDEAFYCIDKSPTPSPLFFKVGREVGNECEAGGYCTTGSKYPWPCFPGQYQPRARTADNLTCLPCPGGMFCDGRPDPTRTDIAIVGGGTATEQAIELAAVENLKNTVPSPKPSGPCERGYYCPIPLPGETKGSPFPRLKMTQPGYFSLDGSAFEYPCLINPTNLASSTTERVNPLNKDTTSADWAAFLLKIPHGFIDPSATNPPASIYPGAGSSGWCEDNLCQISYAASNPIGRYQPQWNSWNCVICPAGFKCKTDALNQPVACGKGQYCVRGTYTDGTNCPAATYSVLNYRSTIDTCQPCIAGYFCNTPGKSVLTDADKCTAGHFCLEKATVAASTDNPEVHNPLTTYSPDLSPVSRYGKCPRFHYCPAFSGQGIPCLPGTYSDALNIADPNTNCATTPAGDYSNTIKGHDHATMDEYMCSEGYYCPVGSKLDKALSQQCGPF